MNSVDNKQLFKLLAQKISACNNCFIFQSFQSIFPIASGSEAGAVCVALIRTLQWGRIVTGFSLGSRSLGDFPPSSFNFSMFFFHTVNKQVFLQNI